MKHLFFLQHSFFGTIEFMLLTPFFFPFIALTNVKEIVIDIIIWILWLLPYLLNFKRYYRKGKVEEIMKKNKNNPYNKKIKSWIFYLIIPVSIIWFFLGTIIFIELLQGFL